MRARPQSLTTLIAVVIMSSVVQAQPFLAAGQEDSAAAQQESIANMSEAELRTAIERFINDFYLAGENLSRDEMKIIYAPVVDYFGERRKTRAAIMKNQRAYYRRWPDRLFEMMPGTLEISRKEGSTGIVDVTFEYFYETRSAKRVSRGQGVSYLTLDFTVAGGQIIREGGKVLKRFR